MKSDNINVVLLLIIIIFGLTGSIMITCSNLKSTDPDKIFNPNLFWVGATCTIIASIAMIIYAVRTGIDLSRPTITRVGSSNTYYINKGIDLY